MIEKKENGIVEGAQVLYVLPNGKVRPAIIVNALADGAFEDGEVNLQVFTDFANDELNPVEWRTSVRYSADKTPGTYSFADGREVGSEADVKADETNTDTTDKSNETAAPALKVGDAVTILDCEKVGEISKVSEDGIKFTATYTDADGNPAEETGTADKFAAVQ
jgi:hypothetical protein